MRRRATPGAPEGGLIVDKATGLTSHDVVAIARRTLRQPRVGHAGTLDPLATGVLVLLLGRATRLAQFLALDEKTYEAVIAFGQATTTCDADGDPIGPPSDALIAREALDATLCGFVGRHLQVPPVVSAKRVAGHRAYDLARAEVPVILAPVAVDLSRADILAFDGRRATIRVACSAGYYVRALARDLGEALGAGAHLESLRRTRSGRFRVEEAVGLEALAARPEEVLSRVVTPAEIVGHLRTVVVTSDGVERVSRGRDLEPCHSRTGFASTALARIVDESGRLLGVGKMTPAALHPLVVLM